MKITKELKNEIFDYWQSKKIVVHKRMTEDIDAAIVLALKKYEVDEIKQTMDFYTKILEPGVDEDNKKYYWSYKWNLLEFLQRGIKKFYDKDLECDSKIYLKKQTMEGPEAIVFRRQ
jgi:hypothetical protein